MPGGRGGAFDFEGVGSEGGKATTAQVEDGASLGMTLSLCSGAAALGEEEDMEVAQPVPAVAEVQSIEKHPKADRLKIVTVSTSGCSFRVLLCLHPSLLH